MFAVSVAAGTTVEIYWYMDQVWYRGIVLDTRVRKGVVHGISIDRREIKVCYESDNQELWHALADYSVRRAVEHNDQADMAVLSMLDAREIAAKGVEAMQSYLMMLGEQRLRRWYCSQCGLRVATVCMEPHCMRGPCCQPNEACARCHTPTPNNNNNLCALDAHMGELFVARQLIFDLESLEAIDPAVAFAILGDATAVELDTTDVPCSLLL